MLRPALITLLVLLSGGCTRTLPTHGATSERALVRAYVDALEHRDARAMERLLHPRSDRAAAETELSEAGGLRIEHVAVTLKYSESVAPQLATAEVSLSYRDANDANLTLTRTLPLVQDHGRWYIGLGLPPAVT